MLGLRSKGRPPVLIAKSIQDVARLRHPLAQAVTDRTSLISDDVANAILGQSIFTYEGRNPTPALDENGDFQGTDLDLLSFLMPLVARGAVIEIPRYRNRRKIVVKANERKVGTNQFGKLRRLVSHKDVLSFSVGIFDNTIAVTGPDDEETLGAHRNYMVVDIDGFWYAGWDVIRWKPNTAENDFLSSKKLWTGNEVVFTNWVHPNRWQAFFGAPYLLVKLLWMRARDEAAFCYAEVDRLEKLGFKKPESNYQKPVGEGATQPMKVETIEVELDTTDFKGTYPTFPNSQAGLDAALARGKYLRYTLQPMAQFVVRADEAAYLKYGHPAGKMAHWLEGRTFEDFKQPKGRIVWRRMMLSNDLAMRYRVKEVTQQVSAE